MRIGVILTVISLATVTLPLSAYSDPAQPNDTAQATPSDGDQIVCKTTPPTTGTRLGGGRECHSQRDWDARQKASQQDLMDKQSRGLQSCIGSCGG